MAKSEYYETNSEYYDTIYDMVSKGYRVCEIKKEIGDVISRQRVAQLREQIIKSNPHFMEVFNKRQQETLRKQINTIKGLIGYYNVSDIASILNISKSTAYKLIKEFGIEIPTKSRACLLKKGDRYGLWEIGELVKERDSNNQLVRFYNCTCTGCGQKHKVRQQHLLDGNSRSCRDCGYKRRGRNNGL